MTTQLVIDIAKRVNEIDGRISTYAEGGCVKGRFRGKAKEDFCYMITKREFIYNNVGYPVTKAVEQAISEFYK